MRIYFHQRRNTIGFLTLVAAFFINFFSNSLFIKLNIAVLAIGVLTLFFYLTALYQKRVSNGNFINLKVKKSNGISNHYLRVKSNDTK